VSLTIIQRYLKILNAISLIRLRESIVKKTIAKKRKVTNTFT